MTNETEQLICDECDKVITGEPYYIEAKTIALCSECYQNIDELIGEEDE